MGTSIHRIICLYDTRNASYNLGQKHAVFTPHYNPDEAGDTEEDKSWRKELFETNGDNPDFEYQEEDFWQGIDEFDNGTKLDGFIITGELGLWNGKRAIYPHRCITLKQALMKCAEKMNHFRVDYQDGTLICYGYHHDGTNVFEINGFSASRMLAKHRELYDDSYNGGVIDGSLFETNRYMRKIPLLKFLGFSETKLLSA